MMKEIWKNISGFEDYQISNLGNIKGKKGNVLKPQLQKDGYYHIQLYKNGKAKGFLIHRLVIINFISPYVEGFEVNHIDGNKLNNELSNLEWVSHKYNMIHAKENGLMKPKKLYNNKNACKKVIDNDSNIIYNSVGEASRAIGISQSHLSNMLKGRLKNKTSMNYI